MNRNAWMIAIVVALVGMLATGCNTGNLTAFDSDGDLTQRTSTGSLSKMDNEGNQAASHQGLPPTLFKIDDTGMWANTIGQPTVWKMPMADGKTAYLMSGKDTVAKDVRMTPQPAPGQPALYIGQLSASASNPLAAQVPAVLKGLEETHGMSTDALKARVDELVAIGEWAPEVRDIVLGVLQAVLAAP